MSQTTDSFEAASGRSTPARILVVDDDRLVLATVTDGLSQAGFEVIDADNGDDAILLARQYRPTLALLDIRMEGLSGFDVAEYLRQQLGTPFMFLSAFADEETRARVKELGAVAYLTKPLDVRQIVPAVKEALQQIRDQGAENAAKPADRTLPGAARTEVSSSLPTSAFATVTGAAGTTAPGGIALQSPESHVAMAVGVVMQRHHVGRDAALERLRRAAVHHQRSLEAQCRMVVDAVELLARTELP